jgi:hypothetical protein
MRTVATPHWTRRLRLALSGLGRDEVIDLLANLASRG